MTTYRRANEESIPHRWRCPHCSTWVTEPIHKHCARCRESIAHAKADTGAERETLERETGVTFTEDGRLIPPERSTP